MKNLKPFKVLNKTGLLTKLNHKGDKVFDPDKYCLFVTEKEDDIESEFRIYSHLYGWDVSVSEDGDIYRQNFKGKKTCPVDELANMIKLWLKSEPVMWNGKSQIFKTNRNHLRFRLSIEN